MAYRPLPASDPFNSSAANSTDRAESQKSGSNSDVSGGSWIETPFDFSTAHLALDVALYAMAEQAQFATCASGAAIALLTGGNLICRASSGDNSPDLGITIDEHSGLSGACVRSRHWQRCDDTQADPRVNAEVSVRLGIRSVLVVPILREENLLGLVEIFSPHVSAFVERDVETLEALCRRIVARVYAPEGETAASDDQDEAKASAVSEPAADVTQEASAELGVADASAARSRFSNRDWTMILNVSVIATALLLGWFLGHPGGRRARRHSEANDPSAAGKLGEAKINAETQVSPNANIEPAKPPSGRGEPAPPANGQRVYPASAPMGQRSAGADRLQIAPGIAKSYVLRRVEPEYPDEARLSGVQGPVVMNVVVGKDGNVKTVTTQSGEAVLAAAATKAVEQWKFRSFYRNGELTDIETRITINFRLP